LKPGTLAGLFDIIELALHRNGSFEGTVMKLFQIQ